MSLILPVSAERRVCINFAALRASRTLINILYLRPRKSSHDGRIHPHAQPTPRPHKVHRPALATIPAPPFENKETLSISSLNSWSTDVSQPLYCPSPLEPIGQSTTRCCSTCPHYRSLSSFSSVRPLPSHSYLIPSRPHTSTPREMSTSILTPPPSSGPTVIIYNRHRLLPILAPILPSALTSRLAHYTPLTSFSFTDQVAAGLSSGNFDVERDNLGTGEGSSSDGRMGLDEAGVEEVRRIM